MERTANVDAPLRCLVLDGDPAALDVVRRFLEARSFSVLSAADGTRGLEVLLDELLHLDVLVVDLDLPRRDARAFADLVRRAGGERDLAIVVVAREPTPGLRNELLALGVDAIAAREAGPAAVAAAARDAVSARARANGPAKAPAAVAPASPARDPRWTLALRWSLAPA